MALSGLARRVRKGPTLLLSEVPEHQRLLETVRLFAPRACADEAGVIQAGDGALRGPIEVTPSLVRQARLPVGWPVAYVGEREQSLVPGLAHRLGGLSFEEGRPKPRRDVDHYHVTVYLPVRPDPSRLTTLISPYAGSVTHTDAPGMDLYSGGQVSALLRPSDARRPHALEGLDGPLMTCDLSETTTDAAGAQLALRVAETALVIAHEYGGVVLDCDNYRVVEPKDLLPR